MREDTGLPFMLRYENIAWYEDGKVRILDRRIYPKEISFVECKTYKEVVKAIKDMVTQSAGPYTAAGMAMALAAYEAKDLKKEEAVNFLKSAAKDIANARPTTVKRMYTITDQCLKVGLEAIEQNKPCVDNVIKNQVVKINERRYARMYEIGKYLAETFPPNGKIMTQCFGETVVAMMLKACKEQNKNIKIFCPETRPYFQGARLTATVCQEMGFDTVVITDNMPAFVMEQEKIDVFTCASDVICMDGTVVNKIGTYQLAICAKRFNIPVYISGVPEPDHPDRSSVTIEMRDPDFVTYAMGQKVTKEGVKGYYPSFDITPPELITGIVTDKGIFKPEEVRKYIDIVGDHYEVTV